MTLRDLSVRDPRLAAELRLLREGLHLENKMVAARVGWSASKLSRIESGTLGITLNDLNRLLTFYKVPPEDKKALLAFADEQSAARFRYPGDYFSGAQEAASVLEWAPLAVPRLLQTADYARALLESMQPVTGMTPQDVRGMTTDLGRWQDSLDGDPPLGLRALFDESVLDRLVGDVRVMRGQLTQLAKATSLPDVQLRVLTLGGGGPAGVAGFTCLEFAAVGKLRETTALLLDKRTGPVRVDDPDEAWRYTKAFDYLWEAGGPAGPAISKVLAETWA
jgi:transcriptional regulator with XRE-family HTH domain